MQKKSEKSTESASETWLKHSLKPKVSALRFGIIEKLLLLDEWEFQQVWDAVYPEKIPGSMRASKSEWMLKQDFRKRAEERMWTIFS